MVQLFTFILILTSLFAHAQTNHETIHSQTVNRNIIDGEKIVYVLGYSWLLIHAEMGEAELSVKCEQKFNRELLHLRGFGKTYKFYDLFFKLRDLYETWVEPNTLQPVYFNRDINEGGYKKENEYWFDWTKNELRTRVRRRQGPNRYDTLTLERTCYDIVTAVYVTRTLDFTQLKPEKLFIIPVIMDEKIYNVGFRFIKRETKKLPNLGRVNCLKFQCEVVVGDVFTGEQKIYVWISDDGNQVPVYAESPVIVGKMKIRLATFSGLKYPLNVQIKNSGRKKKK